MLKKPKDGGFRKICSSVPVLRENRMGGFRKGGVSNNRFVLKPDVAIASEVSILSRNSLAITDLHAKKTQHVQLFENPLLGTPPFAIPKSCVFPSLNAIYAANLPKYCRNCPLDLLLGVLKSCV